MVSECPACGSTRVRFSRRHGLREWLWSLAGFCPVRCKDCEYRFAEGQLWFPGLHYARCPKCLREDLCDWAETYAYPGGFSQFLLNFGAQEHRCRPCRHNFVSFFPRRREYLAPAKIAKRKGAAREDNGMLSASERLASERLAGPGAL